MLGRSGTSLSFQIRAIGFMRLQKELPFGRKKQNLGRLIATQRQKLAKKDFCTADSGGLISQVVNKFCPRTILVIAMYSGVQVW